MGAETEELHFQSWLSRKYTLKTALKVAGQPPCRKQHPPAGLPPCRTQHFVGFPKDFIR